MRWGVLLGSLVLVGLLLARHNEYWEFNEGVNLLSSREFANGADLYSGLIAAQPPPIFLVGALIAMVYDSLEGFRIALSAWQLFGAALGAIAVWRLTGHREATIAAVPLGLMMPWTTRELGTLIPEVIAAPILLAGTLLASRERTALASGLTLAVLATIKLPFLLISLAVCVVAEDRRRCALGLTGGLTVLGAIFGLAFGFANLWRDLVVAQSQVGFQTGKIPGYTVQAAWNLAPLLIGAAAALSYRWRSGDPALGRVLVAACAASLAMFFTTLMKLGSFINALVPAEAVLVPAALAGAVWSLEAVRGTGGNRRLAVTAAAVLLAGGVLVQSLSLVTSPENPRPFTRPFSRSANEVNLTTSEVDDRVEQARACPPGVAYSGDAFIAYLAERSMPAGQPDLFILQNAEEHRDALGEAGAAVKCP